ncbi:D-hexose-6-phosphate mutarotase [Luteolibacter soli]|uniref:Putative glucose-6-phosphate 1-epimerase n=1 Tax=Luteolibacter soli TaxID=3135280 RepID=A0ABU9B387_9BACT
MTEIFRAESVPGFPVHEIRHIRSRARVAHRGAQLLEWTPTGFDPVLYCSRRSVPVEDTAVRGGIPICWPWFADHPDCSSLPLHGFAQLMVWTHGYMETNDDEVRMGFWLEDDADTRDLWPHRFRLDLEICMGARLAMRLRMKNTGDSAFSAGGAFHPYFVVGGLEGLVVSGVTDAGYFDKTSGRFKAGDAGRLRIEGEVDRIYQTTGPVTLCDQTLGRRITVEGAGHRGTVVWNPGPEEAAKARDIAPGDYDHFVAVEPVLPQEVQVFLSPGEEHLMSLEVTIESTALSRAG